MPTPPRSRRPEISDEELVTRYGKFCGFMAWKFVKRSGSYDDGERQVRLDTEDAEDLASVAMYYLLRIPQHHRHEPPYIKRVIVSKIITAWHKRLKYGTKEYQPPHHKCNGQAETHSETEWFDTLPGRDGLAQSTQQLFDAKRMLELIGQLTPAEKIVLELHFGLNGATACGTRRIASKLGRTRWWVNLRLTSGLSELRKLAGLPEPTTRHFQPVL